MCRVDEVCVAFVIYFFANSEPELFCPFGECVSQFSMFQGIDLEQQKLNPLWSYIRLLLKQPLWAYLMTSKVRQTPAFNFGPFQNWRMLKSDEALEY
jgi:hypothetical protein